MNKKELIRQIKEKESFLCIGLDTDIRRIPSYLLELEDPVFEFNKKIIDSTKDLCVAYKPNIAFYESMGTKGWESLQKTLDYIPSNIFTIADAKRGDIGNTSKMYARAFFENMNFDAVTIVPFMGSDSVIPFLEYRDKWAIVLALTSNKGSFDFQNIENKNGKQLYKKIIETSCKWGSEENTMYVVGATKDDYFEKIRALIPESFLLIPGVGSQGGDINKVVNNLTKTSKNILINVSRAIIYASNSKEYLNEAEKSVDYFNSQIDFK